LHLKKDLRAQDKDWANCRNPKQIDQQTSIEQRGDLTSYGTLKSYQERLAGIRTDLDSFSDTEAYALMTAGYKMASQNICDTVKGFAQVKDEPHDWHFLQAEPALRDPSNRRLSHLLKVAGMGMLKVWELSPWLRAAKVMFIFAVAAALIWALIAWEDEPLSSFRGITAAVALLAITFLIGKLGLGWILKIVNAKKTLHQMFVGAGLGVVGWIGTWVHLKWFDPVFLKMGKVTGSENSDQRTKAEDEQTTKDEKLNTVNSRSRP
jgi:hypothetical protein